MDSDYDSDSSSSSSDSEIHISTKNGLTDIQLKNILKNDKKFSGVYMKDQIPNDLQPDKWYIINTQSSTDGDGLHWTCFKNSKPMLYFDPIIGGYAPVEVLEKAKNGINYKNIEIQNEKSTACGWYCVACILSDKGSGNTLTHFKRFISHFSKNTKLNDRILYNLLQNLGIDC